MSRTDRIEQARRHLTSLMAERDYVAAANPVDLVRLRSLDAAIDAEIAGAVSAYEDVLAPIPTPPPPLHWDHTVRIHAALGSPSPDISAIERRATRHRLLLASAVLAALAATVVLLFILWPTAAVVDPEPRDQVVEETLPVAEQVAATPAVAAAAPTVAPAQIAAAPVPDEPVEVPDEPSPPGLDPIGGQTPEATSVEPAPKVKKSKRKRRKRKRKRRRKRKDRTIKMGNSRDPLSGL